MKIKQYLNQHFRLFYKERASKVLFFSTLIIVFLDTTLFGQENGYFNIRNYSPQEYNAHVQNWSAIQDKQGRMYFANGLGVLQYNGTEWQLIKVSNNSLVRSLAIDKAGRIYVGAVGDFGYLQSNYKGKIEFISLLNKIRIEDKKFLDVWFTKTVENDVYFSTNNILFRLRNGQIKTWKTKDRCLNCFVVNDQTYIYERFACIKRITEDSLVPIPYSDFFKNKTFRLVFPFGDNKILIATNSYGLFIFDFDAVQTNKKEKIISKFTTDADSIIRKGRPYSGIVLKDGSYAFSVIPFGVVIINNRGKLLQFLNKESGLQNEGVTDVYQDHENNLWLSLVKGISKIDIYSHLSYWGTKEGLKDIIIDITRFNNSIYIGCFNGLFKLKNNKVIRIRGNESPFFNLLNYNIPTDTSKKMLLGSTNFDGIVEIKDDKIIPILPSSTIVFYLYQSKKDPSYLYIGKSGSLEIAHFENHSFKYFGSVEGINEEIKNITEEADGTIWATNQNNLVIRIKPSGNILRPKQIIQYAREEGVYGNPMIYRYRDRIVLGSDAGLFRLNYDKSKFIPDSTFGVDFCNGTIKNINFKEDQSGKIWISGSKNNRFGIGLQNENGKYDWYETPFSAIPENIASTTYIEKDSTIWILTSEGLYRFKGNLIRKCPPFRTIIRKAVVGKDSILYSDGDSQPLNDTVKEMPRINASIAYKYNSITFYFTALSYYKENSNLFQTHLEGFDKEWTSWTKDQKKEYNYLTEGNYIFHVRAKNIYDVIGDDIKYTFTILPPWYRTIWAFILYFLTSITFIFIIVYLYGRRLKAANIQLERIVWERTNDLSEANAQLEEHQAELEIRQEEITAQAELLAESNKELEKLNNTKDKFFSIIAHDLKNPFNIILGFSDLIIDKIMSGDNEKSLSFAKLLQQTSASAYELLENLLTWSRSQSGAIQYNPEFLDLKKLIDYNIILLEPSSQIKGIKLSTLLNENLIVYADKNMLFTILRNLITNAIKFSRKSDLVTVDAKAVEGYVIVSISDTGVGIQEENINKLFKIGDNIKTYGTANESGTGLGLILCKEFVEYNKGEIWVESVVGKGSRFSFSLMKGILNENKI